MSDSDSNDLRGADVSRNSEVSAGKRSPRGRPFQKGKSGNAKGRPPLPEDYKVALDKTLGPLAAQAQESILRNPDHPRHEQMVEYTINRWQGMPTARHEVTGKDGDPIETADATRRVDDKLRAMLAAIPPSASPT